MDLRIPTGNSALSPIQDHFQYSIFSAAADALEDLFTWHQAPIKPSSELDRILRAARSLGARSKEPNDIEVPLREILDAYCFARLANSALYLDYRPAHRRYFSDLQNGSLNFWNSERSRAKDAEWELFLWSHLNQGMPGKAELCEPDIVLNLPFRHVGIACKKAYSEASIIRQVEAGAEQIKRARLSGIVAVSLDFHLESTNGGYTHGMAEDAEASGREINKFLVAAWKRVEAKVIRKYVRTGRLIGVIFGLQAYVAYRESPHQFIESIGIHFNGDDLGPRKSSEMIDYLYKTMSASSSPGSGGEALLGRIEALKVLRPAAGRSSSDGGLDRYGKNR